METKNNNSKKPESNSIMDTNLNTASEETSAEQSQLHYNNNEKPQGHLDAVSDPEKEADGDVMITEVMELFADTETAIQVTKIEIEESPYNNHEILLDNLQNKDNSANNFTIHRIPTDNPENCLNNDELPKDRPENSLNNDEIPKDKPENSLNNDEIPKDKPENSSNNYELPKDKPENSSNNDELPKDKPENSFINDETYLPKGKVENSLNMDTTLEARRVEVIKKSNNEETRSNLDNNSNIKLEHMMSLKVVLERTHYYGCNNCNLVFFKERDVKLHAVRHLLPTNKESDDDDRFVKRFKCDECGLRFVQLSTLETHAAVHEPFPHPCHCGIGFYKLKDLNSHKNLVHLAEIRDQLATLTDRKQRELKNEIWEPNFDYKPIKKESESPKPKQKARAKPKQRRRKPSEDKYMCPEVDLIVQNDDKTFSCPICFRKFKAKAHVKVHLVTHTKAKPFACDLCDKRFTQAAGLSTHKKLHLGIKEFACGFCGKQFSNEHNMRNHVRTHTGEKPFKCSFCPKAFSDPSAHKRHERTHTGIKPYTCDFCEMKFSDASGLISHRKRHNSTKSIKCTKCHKMFWTKDSLRKHTIGVHGHEKKYQCEVCNKCFALKSYLRIHEKSHFETKRFECDYCGHRSLNKNGLQHHIASVHLHIKNAECGECGMKFYSKASLKTHQDGVHRRLFNYKCDICGERHSTKAMLAKHIVVVHSEVKCETCRKVFANSADLKKHADKGCLRCECGKYFATGGRLRSHKLVHQRNRPYLCDYCDRRFKSKAGMKKHYDIVHDDRMKYECNECGQQFSVRHRLQTHIFSVHSTFLYCHLCRRPFINESELKDHKAKGNCVNIQCQCDICGKFFPNMTCLRTHLEFHYEAKFQCAHCVSKFKNRRSMLRHLQLCHKYLYSTKNRSKLRNKDRTLSRKLKK